MLKEKWTLMKIKMINFLSYGEKEPVLTQVAQSQSKGQEASVGVLELRLRALHEGLHDGGGDFGVAGAHGDHATGQPAHAYYLHVGLGVSQHRRQHSQHLLTVWASVRQTQTCTQEHEVKNQAKY